MIEFQISVEESLTREQKEEILADLEEVIGKHGLSLWDSTCGNI